MPEPLIPPVVDVDGPAAPPRRNGELVFDAVWEGRLFGLTMALHEAGRFEWEGFRARLIAEIACWEGQHDSTETWSFYERWQATLEGLLVEKGLCLREELDDREGVLAARPPGHDH